MDVRNLLLAIFIGLTLLFASISVIEYSPLSYRSTPTSTSTLVSTMTLISTTTQTVSGSGETITTTKVFMVTFQQVGIRPCPLLLEPWSVTLGNQWEVQPPNGSQGGMADKNLSMIIFSVPSGVYRFQANPSPDYFDPTNGTVTVSRTDVTVQIAYTGHGCTASTTVSAT
jgi:hypothetical protein